MAGLKDTIESLDEYHVGDEVLMDDARYEIIAFTKTGLVNLKNEDGVRKVGWASFRDIEPPRF